MSLSILPYTGSKRLDIPFISSFFPTNITTVVEPFGGSGYTSLYLFSLNDKVKCHINDIDPALINFFNQTKQHATDVVNAYNELLKFKSKEEFNAIVSNYRSIKTHDTINDASLYLFYNKVYKLRQGLFPLNKSFNPLKIEEHTVFFDWLKHTTFTNLDYTEIFKMYKNMKTSFIFVDPPYFDSFNAKYYSYQKTTTKENIAIDNTKMFIDIKEVLDTSKCRIMLIINKNHITNYIYSKYVAGEYDKTYQQTQKKTQHLIICNYKKIPTTT